MSAPTDVSDLFYESDGFHGYGTQLFVHQGDGSPGTYKAVAGISSITPGAITTGVIDKTHLRSRNAHMEKMPGMRDSGPFTIAGVWMPKHASQKASGRGLVALSISREVVPMYIALSDGSPETEWPFEGFISSFQPGEIGAEDKVDFTAEITPVRDYSGDLP